jgi:hypothetical protein
MSRFEDNRLFVLNDSHAPRLSPALATEIGLNESILFLQLEFLIAVKGVMQEGRPWIRLSVRELEQEFSFWSYSTINRAVQSLQTRGLITVENFNQAKYDKTRWFSINLDEAGRLRSIAVKGTPKEAPRPSPKEPSGEPEDGNSRQPPEPPAPASPTPQTGGVETRSTQNETGSTQFETRSTQIETAIDRESRQETKQENTRTPATASSPPLKQGEAVCVRSRFSFDQKVAYARNQPRIENPEGFAASERAEAGVFDEAIARWVIEQEQPAGARPERDVSLCPDCRGAGWWYPEGHERGAAKCRHMRLPAAKTVPP